MSGTPPGCGASPRLRSPQFFLLAICDFLRFLIMITLILGAGAVSPYEIRQAEHFFGMFPYLVYCAPAVLFPIMGFFLWLDKESYRPYLYLYSAGKIISLAALAAWLYIFFDIKVVLSAFTLNGFSKSILYFAFPLLCVIDILSLVIVFLSRKAVRQGSA